MAEIKAEKSIIVNAPAENIWRVMLEVAGWPQWFPALKGAGLVSGSALAKDSVLWFKLALVGPALPMRVRVIESVPARRVAWQGGMLGVSGMHSFEFEPQGDNKTRVTSREVLSGPLAGLLKLLFNDDDLGRLHQEWIQALKAKVEKGPTAE